MPAVPGPMSLAIGASSFSFWLHHVFCVNLVPRARIEPRPWAVKAWSPNHWTSREVLSLKPTKGIGSLRSRTRGQRLLCGDACSEEGSLKTLEWFQTSGSQEATGTRQSTQQTQMGGGPQGPSGRGWAPVSTWPCRRQCGHIRRPACRHGC